jgi:hypothetical protein
VADSSYSPRLRTGLVLCGTGTAGAYQAGVLRALAEAGVKIDVVAAHGAGVMTALCAAIDGTARLWDPAGPWTDARLRRAYTWRPALRVAAAGVAAAALLLISPLLILIFATLAYALGVIAALVSLPSLSEWLVGLYRASVELLFNPPVLPTIVPRAVLLAVLVVIGVLVVAAVRAMREETSRRRWRGAFWWRLIGSPLGTAEPGAALMDALWGLVRGASSEPRPSAEEIGRRYVDLLTDNLGQPGFREIIVGVHDLDAKRDLVGGLLGAHAREMFEARRAGGGPREAEIVDFTGPQRGLLVDFLHGALRLPIATEAEPIQFPSDSYWRGERHQVCDRPELVSRLIDEIAGVGVEQLILVSAAPPPALPHGMRSRPAELRSRLGELVRSLETAAFQDACAAAFPRFSGTFVIRPQHNPLGPFDFGGVFDDASDRRRTVAELIDQGHEDAYQYFIEPVVASGDRVEAVKH